MANTESEALAQARAALEEQAEFLERMAVAPLKHGTVIVVGDKRLTIAQGSGDLLDVEIPSTDVTGKRITLKAGDGILLDPEGGQILEKTTPLNCGEPVTILRVDGERAEVSVGGSQKLVFVGAYKLKEGDEVLLDASSRVVTHQVQFSKPRFAVTTETKVTWDSIGGQHEAKAAMREAVELPFKSPEIFKAYNKRPIKGVLLSGPAGCGKTLLGKAAATAVQEMTGASESGFMYIKGPEVLDPYVGVAEATVRKIFMKAKEHKMKTGSPAVVFVDEADAILGKRGTHHSYMEKTIVPAFLTEMDGMEETGALIILATNRPDTLDPAVVRDGRIDRKVRVTRPNLEDTRHIFKLYLSKVPLCKGESIADLSEIGSQALFHNDRALYHLTMRRGNEELIVPLSALVSGSMVAGIVDKAASFALHRDIADNSRKASGITIRDVISGIIQTHRENIDIDHAEIVQDITQGREVIHSRRALVPMLEAAE